jgi:hypothetical protein
MWLCTMILLVGLENTYFKYFRKFIYYVFVILSPLIDVGKQNKYRSKEHSLHRGEGRAGDGGRGCYVKMERLHILLK